MYELTSKDRVVELADMPQSDVGAPAPLVLADENNLALFYRVSENIDWDKRYEDAFPEGAQGDKIAVVKFQSALAHMFGPPNDEAMEGHPLADRGVKPYSAFRIDDSSWIKKLEQMNSVHEHHSKALFQDYIHYIFAFHDSTFECIAKNLEVNSIRGSIYEAVRMELEAGVKSKGEN